MIDPNQKTTQTSVALKEGKKPMSEQLAQKTTSLWSVLRPSPSDYMTERKKQYPHLSWCPCLKQSVRVDLVEASMEVLAKSISKSETLVVTSLGCGGCLQELSYIASLVDHSYRSIRFIGIDENPASEKAFEQLQAFCDTHLRDQIDKIEFIFFKSLDEYMVKAKESPTLQPKLFLLIDLQTVRGNRELTATFLNTSIQKLTDARLIKEGTVVALTWEKKTKYEKGSIIEDYGNGAKSYRVGKAGPEDLREIKVDSIYDH